MCNISNHFDLCVCLLARVCMCVFVSSSCVYVCVSVCRSCACVGHQGGRQCWLLEEETLVAVKEESTY